MSNFNKKILSSAAFATGLAIVLFTVGSANAAPTTSIKAGDKCQVTSGPNKGKTGTYGSDGWCEGDWGGTECGTTKCKIAAGRVTSWKNGPFGSNLKFGTNTAAKKTTRGSSNLRAQSLSGKFTKLRIRGRFSQRR